MKKILIGLVLCLLAGCEYRYHEETGFLTGWKANGDFQVLQFNNGTQWQVFNPTGLPLYQNHKVKVKCEMQDRYSRLVDVQKLDEDEIPLHETQKEILVNAKSAENTLFSIETGIGRITVTPSNIPTSDKEYDWYINGYKIATKGNTVALTYSQLPPQPGENKAEKDGASAVTKN